MQTNYIKSYTNFITEALGVPDNITNIARLIYDKLTEKLFQISKLTIPQLDSKDEASIEIYGEFKIGTHVFNKIEVYFDVREVPDEIESKLIGADFSGQSERLPGKTYSRNVKSDSIRLSITAVVPEDSLGKEVADLIIKSKESLIPILSHELHHAYYHQLSQKDHLSKRAEYISFSSSGFGDIVPIIKFAYQLYYTTAIENIVRPSEVAARIEDLGITTEKFYEFITNTELFKELKEIKELTYDKLRNQLMEYIPNIEDVFSHIDIDFDGWSDDQKIDEILRLTMVSLANRQLEIFRDLAEPHSLGILIGKEKWEDFITITKAHQAEIVKKHSNARDYFTREIGKMNKAADATIRKISKLYAMAKTEKTNESIIDWKLWYKHFATPVKWSKTIETKKGL